jgi:hypothetical protein
MVLFEAARRGFTVNIKGEWLTNPRYRQKLPKVARLLPSPVVLNPAGLYLRPKPGLPGRLLRRAVEGCRLPNPQPHPSLLLPRLR